MGPDFKRIGAQLFLADGMRHLDCTLRRNSTTVSEMLAFIHDLPRILKAAAFTGKWCKCARYWQNPSNTFDEIGRDQPHDFF